MKSVNEAFDSTMKNIKKVESNFGTSKTYFIRIDIWSSKWLKDEYMRALKDSEMDEDDRRRTISKFHKSKLTIDPKSVRLDIQFSKSNRLKILSRSKIFS